MRSLAAMLTALALLAACGQTDTTGPTETAPVHSTVQPPRPEVTTATSGDPDPRTRNREEAAAHDVDEAGGATATTPVTTRDHDDPSSPGEEPTPPTDNTQTADDTDGAGGTDGADDAAADHPVDTAGLVEPPARAPDPDSAFGPPGTEVLSELTLDPDTDGGPVLQAPGALPAPSPVPDDPTFKAGPGCSIQCITSGVAYARGTGAELVVTTDTPARIWLIVWNEDIGYHATHDSGATSSVTTFSKLFDDLEAGTTYQAMAVAEDGDGFASHGWGEFETHQRNLTISFGEADVITTPSGTTGITTIVRIDGEFLDDAWHTGVDPIANADRYLDLQVWLVATHGSDSGICEAFWPGEQTAWSGSHSCYTWTATWTADDIDLDADPAISATATSRKLHVTLQPYPGGALPPGYGQPLNANVPVTLDVVYS